MMNAESKPLVSVCFTCYNQKRFVRKAFQAVLDQTYDPLEIVVSDNCSTDGTREIILDMVEEYRRTGGRHRIVVNCNSTNIGATRNSEKCFLLAGGVLCVAAHDDDISEPDRIVRIVDAWNKMSGRCSYVAHGSLLIDCDDQPLFLRKPNVPYDCAGRYCEEDELDRAWMFGAVMAYSREIVTRFPRVQISDAYEDGVWLYRALMLGVPAGIPNPLLKYRIGSGVSSDHTLFGNCRKTKLRVCLGELKAHEQALIDIKVACAWLPVDYQDKLKALILKRKDIYANSVLCLSGKSFLERWHGWRKAHWFFGMRLNRYLDLPFLLPGWLADIIIAPIAKYKFKQQVASGKE